MPTCFVRHYSERSGTDLCGRNKVLFSQGWKMPASGDAITEDADDPEKPKATVPP